MRQRGAEEVERESVVIIVARRGFYLENLGLFEGCPTNLS